jgi:hypothetical protein
MQTGSWMAYLDSTYFSDKNSYIKYFISSYGLRDMIFARFAQILIFSVKQRTG